MARLWTDGAEFKDTLFWDVTGGIAGIDTVHPRTGVAYYYMYSGSGAHAAYALFGADLSELYIRYCIYGLTATNTAFFGFAYGGNKICTLQWDVYNRPTVRFGDNNIPVDAVGVHPRDNGWNEYEVWLKIANSGGRFILKQNGIVEIDYTGDTECSIYSAADAFYVSCGTSQTLELDDLALNDTTGVDNSWVGDGHLELLNPDDNGDVNDWMGSDGNKIDNYKLVDERPPNGDVDNVFSSTPAEQDMYNVSDFDPTNKIVTRVWAEGRMRDANSLGGEIKLGFKTHGNIYLCAVNRVLPSVYSKIIGDYAIVNPFTTLTWTEAELDAIQFVIECE